MYYYAYNTFSGKVKHETSVPCNLLHLFSISFMVVVETVSVGQLVTCWQLAF